MLCPLCGRETPELAGGICDRCASEKRPFLSVPDVLDVIRCAHCGRHQRGLTWKPVPADRDQLLAEVLPAAVDVDPELIEPRLTSSLRWEDERNGTAHVALEASYRGFPVAREGDTRIRLKRGACNDCSREYGGYFEAILQVRGSVPRGEEVLMGKVEADVLDSLDAYRAEQRTGAYTSKTERVRGGLDFFMGGQEVARLVAHQLVERYGAEYVESSKLVGKRDGRDLVRFTLLVRLPPYSAGDFILFDGRPYRVLRIDRKRIALWDLERKEQVHKEPKRARELRVIGRAEDAHDAIVVSYRKGALQVLDPTNFKTLDLSVGEDFEARETVPLFRYEDHVFVLPPALPSPQTRA